MRWIGHGRRMLELWVEWRRKRDRPKISWRYLLNKCLQGNALREEDARDRERWKEHVRENFDFEENLKRQKYTLLVAIISNAIYRNIEVQQENQGHAKLACWNNIEVFIYDEKFLDFMKLQLVFNTLLWFVFFFLAIYRVVSQIRN